MLSTKLAAVVAMLVVCFVMVAMGDNDDTADENAIPDMAVGDNEGTADENATPLDEETIEYAKGSVCQYCEYCEFCELCYDQCPCVSSEKQPACHMCKYCTYCKFCQVCGTICQPGGIIDKVTGALVSALPSFNQEEVDSEIDGVKDQIKKTREEL